MSQFLDLSTRVAALLADPSPEAAKQLLRLQCVIGERSLADDLRIIQARLWFNVASLELRVRTFAQYLASIPPFPEAFLTPDGNLNLPVLTEGRLGNVAAARAAGLQHKEYGYADDTLVPVDARHTFPREPMWVLAHDGGPDLGRSQSDCLAGCTGEFYAGIDRVGIAIRLIHGPREHGMDLPASVHTANRSHCAYVGKFGGRMGLGVHWLNDPNPRYGPVSFLLENGSQR